MTRPFPFLAEPPWHQGQNPRLCPLWLQGQLHLFFLPLLADLPPVQGSTPWPLTPTLPPSSCPPAGIVASSSEAQWSRRSPVPGHTTYRDSRSCLLSTGCRGNNVPTWQPCRDQASSHCGSGVSATCTCALARSVHRLLCVNIGIRSGWGTLLWLSVAALLSLGFPLSQVPLMSAGQGDLTPLFMCNLLHRLS